MDLLYFKSLCNYALNSRNGEIMAIMEVWENVPIFLMKSFKIGNKSLVFRTWKVKGKKEKTRIKYECLVCAKHYFVFFM